MVIGLTGGIGSGKTTVAKMFAKFDNVALYIADIEAKQLMNSSNEIKQKLIKIFGKETYNEEGLNRPYLANIVFNDKTKLKLLNSIVHPIVNNHFKDFIKKNNHCDYIIYENAILFENKSNQYCDKIITVTSPLNIRVNRVTLRDKSTKKEVLNRINNQWSQTKKTLQSNYVIKNIKLEDTEAQVFKIHNFLTKSLK